MPPVPSDRRPPLVVAYQMVSQITTIAITMVLPVGLGYWGDEKLGTRPWLMLAGVLLGGILSTFQLVEFVKRLSAKNRSPESPRSSGKRKHDV